MTPKRPGIPTAAPGEHTPSRADAAAHVAKAIEDAHALGIHVDYLATPDVGVPRAEGVAELRDGTWEMTEQEKIDQDPSNDY